MRAPARSLAGALVTLLGLAVGGCETSGTVDAQGPGDRGSEGRLVGQPGRYATELTRRTNDVRTAEGLDLLAVSRCLDRAAVGRARELVGGPLEHRPLPDVARRCTDTGRVAENLVRSAATPAEVLTAWMESTGHRNNLVDPAMREVGTGCRRDDGELLCVQLYLQEE